MSRTLSHVGWLLWGQGTMVHHTEIASLSWGSRVVASKKKVDVVTLSSSHHFFVP